MDPQIIIDTKNTEEDFGTTGTSFESKEVKEILKQKFNIEDNFNSCVVTSRVNLDLF